jgi:4-carboxymuconolactone decarboxylase
MKNFKILLIVLAVLVIIPVTTYGAVVVDEAGDHIPAPPDVSSVISYREHITGNNQYQDGTLVNRDTNLKVDVAALRFAHFSQIGSFPVAASLSLPYGSVSLDGAGVGGRQLSSTEIGDVTLTIAKQEEPKKPVATAAALAQAPGAKPGEIIVSEDSIRRKMQETAMKLFGKGIKMDPPLWREFDKDLANDFSTFIIGKMYSRKVLTLPERQMAACAMLAALRATAELKDHINAALNVGCDPRKLAEIFFQVATYAGMPAVNEALKVYRDVLKERGEWPIK